MHKKAWLTAMDWLVVSMALFGYLFRMEFGKSSVKAVQMYLKAKS
jgi:hypothetical protein